MTARRTDRRRLFDFLWMFHIMDYSTRDDFNTVWLQLASVLGLITVFSGFILAGLTSSKLRRSFGGRKLVSRSGAADRRQTAQPP